MPRGFQPVRRSRAKKESASGLDFDALDTSVEALLGALQRTSGDPPPGFELFAVGDDDPFENLYVVDRGGYEPDFIRFSLTSLLSDEPCLAALDRRSAEQASILLARV